MKHYETVFDARQCLKMGERELQHFLRIHRNYLKVVDGKGNIIEIIKQHDAKEKKRWRADFKGKFFFVNNFLVASFNYDFRTDVDDEIYYSGNYFPTEEEAETVAAKFRAILDEHNKNP